MDSHCADFGVPELDDVSFLIMRTGCLPSCACQADMLPLDRIEVAYFVVPWMYLCSVDAALTFLLFNSLRHLVPVRQNAQSAADANVPLPAAQVMAQVPILYRSQEHTNGASPHCAEADVDGRRTSSDSEEVQTPTSDDVVICLDPSVKV